MTGASQPTAIFLTGTIGAGKTTLGRALAEALGGSLVEGDDYQKPPLPWFATALSTSRGVLAAVLAAAPRSGPVIVSYPLRCREWIFYRRRLSDAGVRSAFVTLAASPDALLAKDRGRMFSPQERRRIEEMHRQGYGEPRFADLVVRTDRGSADEALVRLLAGLRKLGFTG